MTTPTHNIGIYDWVPEFARGFVRDLRVRWTLEEIGEGYTTDAVDVRAKPPTLTAKQPFGQVPWYDDGAVEMFESGAICLWVAQQSGKLIGASPDDHAKAISWTFAALNSIEPVTQQLGAIELFHKGESWTEARRPQVLEFLDKRIGALEAHLAGRDWLGDDFSVGDILMASVLRDIPVDDYLDRFPVTKAYRDRCLGRPAFARALAAQMGDFKAIDAAPPEPAAA